MKRKMKEEERRGKKRNEEEDERRGKKRKEEERRGKRKGSWMNCIFFALQYL
jgi:hypothetical protein